MADNNDYNESFSYCFTFLWTDAFKPAEPVKTQFEINKPKRIDEFIKKVDMLYDEYHAELCQGGVFHYLGKLIDEAEKSKLK